jgi:carbamoyl-phosphate synthase large subunit
VQPRGTAEYIRKHGMKCKIINKVSSGSPHIVDVLDSKRIALVINTGGGNSEHRLNDAIALRRATLKNKVPYCTNMSTAQACLEAIKSLKTKEIRSHFSSRIFKNLLSSQFQKLHNLL